LHIPFGEKITKSAEAQGDGSSPVKGLIDGDDLLRREMALVIS
jgi:hypothetical protein